MNIKYFCSSCKLHICGLRSMSWLLKKQDYKCWWVKFVVAKQAKSNRAPDCCDLMMQERQWCIHHFNTRSSLLYNPCTQTSVTMNSTQASVRYDVTSSGLFMLFVCGIWNFILLFCLLGTLCTRWLEFRRSCVDVMPIT